LRVSNECYLTYSQLLRARFPTAFARKLFTENRAPYAPPEYAAETVRGIINPARSVLAVRTAVTKYIESRARYLPVFVYRLPYSDGNVRSVFDYHGNAGGNRSAFRRADTLDVPRTVKRNFK